MKGWDGIALTRRFTKASVLSCNLSSLLPPTLLRSHHLQRALAFLGDFPRVRCAEVGSCYAPTTASCSHLRMQRKFLLPILRPPWSSCTSSCCRYVQLPISKGYRLQKPYFVVPNFVVKLAYTTNSFRPPQYFPGQADRPQISCHHWFSVDSFVSSPPARPLCYFSSRDSSVRRS